MESYSFIWNSVLLILSGTILLRVAGRKSISQMTVAQTVIMISIGSIIIQPIIEDSVLKTIIVSAIFIGALILMEYLQVKFNMFEKFLTGKSMVVVKDGIILTDNLSKLRFSVDQLEMRLRQKGITNITDVKTATLEPNGQIGYELKRHAKPVTIGEMEKMLKHLIIPQQENPQEQKSPLFDEVINKGHEQPNIDKLH